MITLYDEAALEQALQNTTNPVSAFKTTLKDSRTRLFELFEENTPIEKLVRGHANAIDNILTRAWQLIISSEEPNDVGLIAVGGYGRGELHPSSDVDILILLKDSCEEKYNEAISEYITFLWDIGLDIGSSVRSLSECVTEAKTDITIATNIVESRLIYGPDDLYEALSNATGPTKIWPSSQFFEAKWDEQIKRHHRFHDTAYNLEPNVKESPGGLRDIQMIGWVAKRHFGELDLRKLVDYEFLTETELCGLLDIQSFLWEVRFILHMINNRREDRLLFEHQRVIAKKMGFEDERQTTRFDKSANRAADGSRLAVELFMKQYYRSVMELGRLNEMLLQHYQETILIDGQKNAVTTINKRFQVNKGFLEVQSESIFKECPFAILEIFLLLQQNPQIKGIRASTIRLIRENVHLIDEHYRQDPRNINLFIEIFKQPAGLTNVLRRMNNYGVLAAYIPAFGKIVGQMQFDLFHIYTVDQHTLFVVRNLRRFFVESYQHEFPLCTEIIRNIPKPELLYIAGLFHDIGKGRGGDHSKLGAVDARDFCLSHGLSHYDTDLVCWLVTHHLIMSSTAQHKDLSDPDVIFEFAQKLDNGIRLDYLYLLTVADMRATNTKIWNSWKDSLLKMLRRQTKTAFQRGLENPLKEAEQITQTKNTALAEIESAGYKSQQINALWETLGDEFFLRYTPQETSLYSQKLLANIHQKTLIHIEQKGLSGGTDIFIKTPINANLLTNSSLAIDRLRLNIVEAKIVSSKDNNTLNTFSVLEFDGRIVSCEERIQEIKSILFEEINNKTGPNKHKIANASRKIECFIRPTEINFVDNEQTGRTSLEIITTDRRGLLALIARVFMEENIRVSKAKITTLGAQVNDIFFIRDGINNRCLSDIQKQTIKENLLNLLDCR